MNNSHDNGDTDNQPQDAMAKIFRCLDAMHIF